MPQTPVSTQQRSASDTLADHMSRLFEQAPSFMAVLVGREHVFEMTNRAFLKLVGHRELVGKAVRDALPEVAGQGFFELLDGVYETGEAFVGSGLSVDLQNEPDGPICKRAVNFVYQPIAKPGGEIYGILVEGSDVTDLLEAQAALAEKVGLLTRLERQQALHLELADALLPVEKNSDIAGRAAVVLERELGANRVAFAEIRASKDTFHVWHLHCSDIATDMVEAERALSNLGEQAAAALESGHPVVIPDLGARSVPAAEFASFMAGRAGMAGLAVPVMRNERFAAFVVLARYGDVVWSEDEVSLASAVAERAWDAVEAGRDRAALKAERDESRHIFDNMAEGFAIMDARWEMKQINALGLQVGQREEQVVVGRSLWDVWPEIIGTEVETRHRRVMSTRQPESFEELVTFSNGESIWLELRLLPTLNGGMAVFYRDIGERKHLLEKLIEADRRKDEFLAMLAHELRNPLAPITSAAQMLAMVHADGARVLQISQVVARQAKHMGSLIDDLLDVSRVTSGLVALDEDRIDLNHVVEESIEQVAPIVAAKRHRLDFSSTVEPAMVLGDRKRLVQVITNLLQNAAKYTPEGGHLSVALSRTGERIEAVVKDDGSGIDEKLLPFVFDLFTQARRSSDRAQGGLGLGLALVSSLVELHHGSVEAASDGPGKGATFRVCLPAIEAEPADLQAVARQVTVAPKPLRLLVVDDNVDAADMLALFLESTGHQVAVQYSSAEALETAEHEKYDVFLLDIGLPDLDGNELARRLRAHSKSARATMIAVTGYGQQYDRASSIAAGFDYYFVKPADPKLLVELLAGISPH